MAWNDKIGVVADIIGIAGAFLTLCIAISIGAMFRLKQWWYRVTHGVAMSKGYIVIIGNKTTERSVKDFIKNDEDLKRIGKDAIAFVETPDVFTTGNVDDFLRKYVRLRELVRSKCESDICHLFMQCPLPVSAMIGGHLYNKGLAYLYHYQDGTYHPYGKLHRI
jgi:hypothetical protein